MKNIEMNHMSDMEMEKVSGGTLTKDEALAKALEHAMLKKSEVDSIKRVEMDYKRGRKVYEITFYQGGFEYEFDIDAETGSVLRFEKDWD